VKRATALPPALQAWRFFSFVFLGLTPQALRLHLLRRFINRFADDQSNVTLVILNSICFQKRNELISKRKFLMMLFLACNVLLHLLQI